MEIEDAKMTDVAMKGTEKAAKSKQEPSEKAEKAPQQAEPSAAGPETAKEPIPSEKPAPEPAAEPTSHAQPSPAPAASQPEVQPEEKTSRSPPDVLSTSGLPALLILVHCLTVLSDKAMEGSQTDLISSMTDARVILIIVDHSTLLRAMVAVMVLSERDLPARPLPDDPSRGPAYRDGRLPKEPDWPDRHGRMRAPPDAFHGRPEAPPGGPRSVPRHTLTVSS
jgi:THO complex subunit 2